MPRSVNPDLQTQSNLQSLMPCARYQFTLSSLKTQTANPYSNQIRYIEVQRFKVLGLQVDLWLGLTDFDDNANFNVGCVELLVESSMI